MKSLIHYWRLYRLYRACMSRTQAVREVLRAAPF